MAVGLLFPSLDIYQREEAFDPLSEKYTAEYIEREACLLLRVIKNKHRNDYGSISFVMNPKDVRIINRWHIYKKYDI